MPPAGPQAALEENDKVAVAIGFAEVKLTSLRTKDALQAAKRRGQLLGSARPGHWQGREAQRKLGARSGALCSAKARTERTKVAYLDVLPTINELRSAGASLSAIAEYMNARNIPTRTGKRWHPTQISRVLRSSHQGITRQQYDGFRL